MLGVIIWAELGHKNEEARHGLSLHAAYSLALLAHPGQNLAENAKGDMIQPYSNIGNKERAFQKRNS